MSQNTQTESPKRRTHEGQQIRAGLLLGLVDYVTSPAAGREETRCIRSELLSLDIPDQAERWMPGDVYLEALARVDHVDDLGAIMLRAGRDQAFEGMGLFGRAVIHAENLWAALSIIRDATAYVIPGARCDIRIQGGRCRFTYLHPFGPETETIFDVQYTVGLLCNVLAERTGTRSANMHVVYPGSQSHHGAFLGEVDRISEGEVAMIEFDDHLLLAPLKRSIPAMSEVILSAMDGVPEVPDPTQEISDLVALLQIASVRAQQRPLSQRELAELLGAPIRTLQHTLQREGSRFDQLRDAPRHAIAREALLQGREIDEVAGLVGFAHRQNFSRAFSKWEGCSPSEFRSCGH